MRFFVDTANMEDIQAAFHLGLISGVTTNPVLIHREHTYDIKGQIQKIRQICSGEIFTQVLGRSSDEMIAQAKAIWSWDNNITVKIPMNTEGVKAVASLSDMGIRTCATITYTAAQALAAAVSGASYVALFVNRSNAVGNDGFQLVQDVAQLYKANAFPTKIVAASIDTPMDVVRVAQAGVDIVTAGYSTWVNLLTNKATDETLDSFLADWGGKEIT